MFEPILLQMGPEFLLSNIWIIFFLILFLVPMIQRRYLEQSRRRLLVKMGKKRGSVVVTLIHRQEVLSFLGIPLARYIDIDDSEQVLRAIRTTPKDVPIDLILHTPGGLALAATQIALALKAHPARKTVIIPHYAMSGGTLIALAVDEIIMDPHAALGPVDPQLGDRTGSYPATSLVKLMAKKKIDEVDDKTIVLADQAQKALSQMDGLVRTILDGKCDGDKAGLIIEEFVSGKYTHDHPFLADDAKRLLGDCVKTDVPAEVYDLMKLYRMEVARRRPGVEYVPVTEK
ncbi:SDH family Clp fold serine proteinase [Methanocrinis sp.]|uniref:SDH family Clp fold serine proteinase n=1 Tax=Methanocrinis sp. TaxID=3101522 RepID=UPI003D13D33B